MDACENMWDQHLREISSGIDYDLDLDVDEADHDDEAMLDSEEPDQDDWAAYTCCGGSGCNYCLGVGY